MGVTESKLETLERLRPLATLATLSIDRLGVGLGVVVGVGSG